MFAKIANAGVSLVLIHARSGAAIAAEATIVKVSLSDGMAIGMGPSGHGVMGRRRTMGLDDVPGRGIGTLSGGPSHNSRLCIGLARTMQTINYDGHRFGRSSKSSARGVTHVKQV